MRRNIFIGLVLGAFSVTSVFGLGIRPGIKAGYMNMSITPKKETITTTIGGITNTNTTDVADSLQKATNYNGLFGELSLDMELLMGVGFGLSVGYANTSHTDTNDVKATVSSLRITGVGSLSRPIIPGIGYYLMLGPVVSLDKVGASVTNGSSTTSFNGELVTNLGVNAQAGLNLSLIPFISVGGGVLFDYMIKSGSKYEAVILGIPTTYELEQSQWNLGVFLKVALKII